MDLYLDNFTLQIMILMAICISRIKIQTSELPASASERGLCNARIILGVNSDVCVKESFGYN